MSLPPRQRSPSTVMRLALAVVCLAPLALPTAVGAARQERPDDVEVCGAVLSRLSDVAASLGYSVRGDAFGLEGVRGRGRLHAGCSAGHVGLVLAEEGGPTVSVHVGGDAGRAAALEIVGRFPGVGSLSQTAIIDDVTAEPLTGSLAYRADAGEAAAFVDLDLRGEVLTSDGDATALNERFEPVLAASAAWRDARALTLALASVGAIDEAALDILPSLALPVAGRAADSDVVHAKRVCATALAACVITVFLPPSVWGCGSAVGGCLAAVACAEADCGGDGRGG